MKDDSSVFLFFLLHPVIYCLVKAHELLDVVETQLLCEKATEYSCTEVRQ